MSPGPPPSPPSPSPPPRTSPPTDPPNSKHTNLPAGLANFAELQIKTSRFMFFITRLTENTNLAASIPPSERVFNAARVNILLVRPRFAELDIAARPRGDMAAAFAKGAGAGSEFGAEVGREGREGETAVSA